MNLDNVNKAIAVMERVKARGDRFDLCTWREHVPGFDPQSEQELHTCGTAACFAGWVAVSPEFRADGGSACTEGTPKFPTNTHVARGGTAIAHWLDIPISEAENLCGLYDSERVYGVEMEDEVTVDHVLAALYRLRDTGSADLEPTQ